MQEVLLEILAQKCDCYISSLPAQTDDPALLAALRAQNPTDYSLPEWGYCLSYLYRKPIELHSYEELDRFLAEK